MKKARASGPFSLPSARGRSAQDDLAVDHAHVGVLADAAEVTLVDHDGAAIVHAHADVVGVAGDVLLDLVAGQCATHRACGSRDVLVAAAATGVVGDFSAQRPWL
ncbi:hypothetical protein G6F50_016217 [Rhizopus delemar]|uniref:Uncharacterized protein n=1 Tax=Rhizopus delemar TaxID=936053 RepID=A0A9P6XTU6_9FUNG|nr:hypothetical protein G6F50_016217 [Rhizopus delemar]